MQRNIMPCAWSQYNYCTHCSVVCDVIRFHWTGLQVEHRKTGFRWI